MNELDNLIYRVQLLEKAVTDLQDYFDDELSEVDHCVQFLEEAVAGLQGDEFSEVDHWADDEFDVFLCDELGLDWEEELFA